jgi:hypothetical protein
MLLRVASEVFNVSDTQHSQQGLEQGLGLAVRLAPGIVECCPR